MRARLTLTLMVSLAVAVSSLAADTGHRAPEKISRIVAEHVPDPAVARQGADTIADAVEIPELPFEDAGTTVGYSDDYDEVCPYAGSTSPDVVYCFAPTADVEVDIDMLGSTYDTKIYLYDADLDLVACNDDWYPDYVSKLEQVALSRSGFYYLVIDGWGGEAGDYVLAVTEHVPCTVTCSPIAMREGEPPLVDDYDDTYNCGCNCLPDGVFQDIPGDATGHRILCGVSGWYLRDDTTYRDTDWFHLALPANGTINLEIAAEIPTFIYQIDLACNLGIIQSILADPCTPATMTFLGGESPRTVRIAVMPTTFEGPPGPGNEYTYELRLSGLEPATVAVETVTWSAVKGLFRRHSR